MRWAVVECLLVCLVVILPKDSQSVVVASLAAAAASASRSRGARSWRAVGSVAASPLYAKLRPHWPEVESQVTRAPAALLWGAPCSVLLKDSAVDLRLDSPADSSALALWSHSAADWRWDSLLDSSELLRYFHLPHWRSTWVPGHRAWEWEGPHLAPLTLEVLPLALPSQLDHLHLAQALQALEALQVQAPQTLAPQALPGIPPSPTPQAP